VDIQASFGWSDVQIGLLTAIPILCLALAAPVVPGLARRLGRIPTTMLGLALIAVGAGVRAYSELWPPLLVVSAGVGGVGIAIGAVLLPSFVQQWFPQKATTTTGLTAAFLIFGAAAAAALAVPLSLWTGSWPRALAAWAIPPLVALPAWLYISRRSGSRDVIAAGPARLPWRSSAAWSITAFLTLNAVAFYSLVAWMATSYDQRGWTQVEGGVLLGYGTAMQIVGAIVVTRVVQRLPNRRPAYAVMIIATSVALLIVGFAPGFLTWIVVGVLEIGLGAGFALGLALLPERAKTPAAAARATAMAFLVTYSVASLSPMLVGALASLSHSWATVYTVLAVVVLGQLAAIVALKRGATIE
ncbi:MAG: MFS transporter, partial [Actinomycetota bacterium]|nr:MFS transporter [Actinomycetota bacterium]